MRWATGHGGTLWPLTASRVHLVASDLIDTYLAYAPFRTVIRDPKERWLGDGVRRLAAVIDAELELRETFGAVTHHLTRGYEGPQSDLS